MSKQGPTPEWSLQETNVGVAHSDSHVSVIKPITRKQMLVCDAIGPTLGRDISALIKPRGADHSACSVKQRKQEWL